MRKALPFLAGVAVVAGCVGLGANAAYGTPPGQEIAQNHTTVLWEYPGYPDITKPQPYVVSTRGANINSFNDVVKQPGLCGKTYQVDVYKTVVNGKNVSSLWSKGYLEYAHDGGFLAYEIGTTPYKVLTGKDTECTTSTGTPTTTPTSPSNTTSPSPSSEPTTPVVTPEPTPTDTPTSPPVTPPSTGTPAPEPTDTAPSETPSEPTSPATSTPTTPTGPGTTAPSPTPSGPPSPGGETPVPSTEPTVSPTTQTPAAGPTATSSSTPGVPTTTQHGTTQKTHSTDDTARTLAYTGISVIGPLIAAAVLILLGVGALLIRKRRNNL